MDKARLVSFLEGIDRSLERDATLYVYGSSSCILLDEPERTSIDIDVAAPYCVADFADVRRASESAGLPVNPDEEYNGEHIEWIAALRLCLAKPDPDTDILLWRGCRLTVKTVAVPDLIASRLIRYDEIDQTDIQYLCRQANVGFADVEQAAKRLPSPFDRDSVVLENLDNLKTDMAMWGV